MDIDTILNWATGTAVFKLTGYVDNIKIVRGGTVVNEVYTDGDVLTYYTDEKQVSSAAIAVIPLEKAPLNTVLAGTSSVITYNALNFGAVPNDNIDDSAAIQGAIEKAAEMGGGTVYVPAGTYKCMSSLIIPGGVTLIGDWVSPADGGGHGEGTVLESYDWGMSPNAWPLDPKEGEYRFPAGNAFIQMLESSTLKNISVHYPEQDDVYNMKAYPPTIQNLYGNGATIENITLYNSYYGIRLGSFSNQLQYVRNIYGTVYKTGISIDCNFDIPRVYDIHFSPDIWANSDLDTTPDLGDTRTIVKANFTGILLGRVDYCNFYNINIDYANIGIDFYRGNTFDITPNGDGGPAFASVSKLNISNAKTGIRVKWMSEQGLTATDSSIHADKPVETFSSTPDASIAFNKTAFSGGPVTLGGNMKVSFQGCSFSDWKSGYAISISNGALVVAGSTFAAGNHINRGTGTKAVNLVSNTYSGTKNISGSAGAFNEDAAAVSYDSFGTKSEYTFADMRMPNKNMLINVKSYGAKGDETTDDTAAFKRALADLGKNGGGTLYIPGGRYIITQALTVPANTRIKGIHDSAHHTMTEGSVLMTNVGKNDASGTALITLSQDAGVDGIDFFYIDQHAYTSETPIPYSYAIRGNGSGVYVQNVSFVNVYQGIDFSQNSDDHLISKVMGCTLKNTFFVGDSNSGVVENIHINPHFWYSFRAYGTNEQNTSILNDNVYIKMLHNGTAFIFGDNENEKVFSLFTFIQNMGMQFIDQGNGGTNADMLFTVMDGPMNTMEVIKAKTLNLVNPYFYNHDSTVYTDRTYVDMKAGNGATVNLWNIQGGFRSRSIDALRIADGTLNVQQMVFSTGALYNNIKGTGGNLKIHTLWFTPPYDANNDVYAGWRANDFNLNSMASVSVNTVMCMTNDLLIASGSTNPNAQNKLKY